MRRLDAAVQDVRFGARQLRRRPSFTGVALLVIAAGIGVNAATLSFLSAVYARTLPVPDAGRLVAIHGIDPRTGRSTRLPSAQVAQLREQASSFSGLVAQEWAWTWLAEGDRSVEWRCGVVSADYFGVLGVTPLFGRFFTQDDDESAVVLSQAAWLQTFDGDPHVLGRGLRLNQRAATVIGVAPAGFEGVHVGDALDAWTITRQPSGALVGRLRPGRSVSGARAEVLGLAARSTPLPSAAGGPHPLLVEPLRGVEPALREGLESFPALFAGVTACVLLLASANLASLLLARSDSRRPEIALRLALGASRGRLVRQLLTESVLLAVAGGALGLGVAACACRALEHLLAWQLPETRLVLDGPIILASTALSAITGIAFGLAPAVQATRRDRFAIEARHRRIAGSWAVAAQVAIGVVLASCAGLLLRSLYAVSVRPGLDADRIAHFRLRPSRLGYTTERATRYQRDLVQRLGALPGVVGVTMARVPPDRGWCCAIAIEKPGEPRFDVDQNEVVPGYLAAMGIPLLQGRDFVDGDRDVLIVDESLAFRLWPGQPAVGRVLRVEGRPHTVIGVARASHVRRGGEATYPYLYLPLGSRGVRDVRLFVRTSGPAGPLVPVLRREVVAVDPDVHVGQESTLSDRMAMTHQRERMMAAALQLASAGALLLGAVGLYGVMAYQVSRRTREIGVRMALGASPRRVAAWTLRRALAIAGAGLALGTLAAWPASRLLRGLLFAVSPGDPGVLAAAVLVMLATCLGASLAPAWRAARVEPAAALRHD
ncbi:MAG TPA: ADOP family duplicated permease [Vicinamibacteria bacterium]|nr:ADOP family duplicated permease [Vicinamibacteria bacterium]